LSKGTAGRSLKTSVFRLEALSDRRLNDVVLTGAGVEIDGRPGEICGRIRGGTFGTGSGKTDSEKTDRST